MHLSLFIEDKFPNIIHSMDIWHKSKKLKKSLAEVIMHVHACIILLYIVGGKVTGQQKDIGVVG